MSQLLPHVAVPYEHVGGAFADSCEECKLSVRDRIHKVPLFMAQKAYDVFTFDGCPCFHYEEEGVELEGHCWRVCCSGVGGTGVCCLHYDGDPHKAKRARTLLNRMDWYGKWLLVRGGLREVESER